MEEVEHLSDEDIINLWNARTPSSILGPYNSVAKITPHVVVKSGIEVTEVEANNQRQAAMLLDATIVRVPKVYRFFTRKDFHNLDVGYLVMEFIPGTVKNAEDLVQTDFDKLAEIMTYFNSIHRDRPGTLDLRGPSYHCPFEEDGVTLEGDVEAMELWFKIRLEGYIDQINFQHAEFVFCHRDLAPRNIIWQEDGQVYLLDWMTAGFYPREFEVAAQRNGVREDMKFNQRMQAIMSNLERIDMSLVELLLKAHFNSLRCAYLPIPKREKRISSLDRTRENKY